MAKRGRPFIPVLDRLADKFTVGDGCWEWTAGISSNGYGAFELRGTRAAHRVVYELMVGPVPEGLELDHLCRNRKCVRPAHLEPVTHRENLARSPLTYVDCTHCIHGHEFTEANTFHRKNRQARECRTCMRERDRRARKQQRSS